MTDVHGKKLSDPGTVARTPEEIRNQGNHLKDEPSLYLQQHAHNPLDWYPWGPAALDRAKAEDKPIFLSIGYSSCHWCHVMEHETFEQDEVAAFMNEHFICIKVDREERPDLDAVYMEAVQMMTGRGGWPMSVFLTPDLKPFYGGTYFPRAHFLDLAGKISHIFREKRDQVDSQADQVAVQIGRASEAMISQGEGLDPRMIQSAVDRAKQGYDPDHAGFKQAQKFPTPVKWRFLLHEYRFGGGADLAAMITASLEAMARGGLYDHLGGGFHRYTVDADWTVPHFEKMLYDNGQLAGLMLEAGVVFDRPEFTATGLDVLDFLLREMRAESGGIFASFDADSGGEEGSYYVWSPAEIEAVVGPKDGRVLAEVLGVSAEGNFENTGRSVLTRRADLVEIGTRHGRSLDEVKSLFDSHRAALRSARDKRTAPGLDRKVVTSWNGLAIGSLAQGFAVSADTRYLDGAKQAADFLLTTHLRPDGSLWRTSSDGQVSGEGILDDYAFLADGLLELYQVSGEQKYLRQALELTNHVLEHFDRPEGGFYLTPVEVEAPLGRRVEYFDSVEPSGNAMMVNVLVKMAALTGETRYLNRAQQDLDRVADLLERAGPEMACWFDAARKLTGPFYDVVIAGPDAAMAETLGRTLPANAVYTRISAAGPDASLLALAPALDGKSAAGGKTTAYVCRFGTCHAPTADVREMMAQVTAGWKR